MRIIILLIFLALLAPLNSLSAAEKGLIVKGVRYSTYPAFTRIVFEVEAAAPYVLTRSQDNRSIMLGSYEGPLVLKAPLPQIRDAVVSGLEPWEEGGRTYAVIRLDASAGPVKDFTLRGPDRIVLDISKSGSNALSTPRTEQTLLVVLDPGHGGKDSGLLTGQGAEKNFNLELAQAVKKILRKADRFKVLLTREKDQLVSLDERAAMANTAGAAVFVSIHAAPGSDARVYIQDLVDEAGVSASPTVRPSGRDFIGFESENVQQKLVWGRQQASHVQQSGGLGRMIIRRLTREGAEPVQAPLAGLTAVDAAAVIAEIGMEYDRTRAAEAIAGGIEQYVADIR
jgi:N-acetylmuramoyl-L-alanine amidase